MSGVTLTTPLTLHNDEPLVLRIFLDASLIEVFANERRSITSRIYPTRPDSTGIAICADEAAVDLLAGRVWRWPESGSVHYHGKKTGTRIRQITITSNCSGTPART